MKTNQSEAQLKKTHLYINEVYFKMLFGQHESDQLDQVKYSQFKKMESDWIEEEKSNCLKNYDCHKKINEIDTIKNALKNHAVCDHPIFHFLMNTDDINILKKFVKSESILNLEFFDYLVLSIVGVSGKAKAEIASNIWDEAGKGNSQRFHTVLFNNLLNDLGVKYDRNQCLQEMSWQGIAGINLFNYLSIYSFNKMKYFGMLAATELLDPDHYHRLLKGISKIAKSKKLDKSYYVEHELIDVDHANGWINNVILPELCSHPEKVEDFWLGFYMRLDSAKKYYDSLLNVFTFKNAA